jgi:multidrug efflux pump subunit AcrB
MPIAERNQFAVEIYLPAGSSLSATTAIADSLEHMLAHDKRIVSIASFHGMSSPRFQTTYAPQVGGPNYAQFIVNTVSNQATIDLLNEYTPKYQNWFPGAWVKFKQLSYSNAKHQIEVRLTGQNQEANRRLADTVVSVMRSMPGLAMVRTGEGNPLVSATVEPDEAAMSRLGLNTSELELNLAMRYSTGLPLGTLWEGDYGVGVVVKTAAADSATVSDLAAEPFSFLGATSTRLSDFASIRPAYHPGMINYRGGNPVTIVTAVAQRGEDAMTQTELLQQRLKGLDIPADVALSYGGEYEQTMEFLPQIGTAMLIAIVIIFFILIFHYRSVSVPSVMILSLLFVIPGAAFGLLAMNEVISLTCSLGMISLMGILVRNVIIMFDYAEELQAQGESVRDATFHAAQRRMRPIFLTSAAATMGVVPMVVSGSALWKPMGIVIFFGTPVTMAFILTVIPILYWKLCGKSQPTIDNPVYPTPEPAVSVTNVNQPNTSAE